MKDVPSPNRITLFERDLFWTDATKSGLLKTDKLLPGKENSVSIIYQNRSVTHDPIGLKVVHSLLQPQGQYGNPTLRR